MGIVLPGAPGPAEVRRGWSPKEKRRRSPDDGHATSPQMNRQRSTSDRQRLEQVGDELLPWVLPEHMAPRRKGGSEDGVDRDHRHLTR
jgi:hypothetical protein